MNALDRLTWEGMENSYFRSRARGWLFLAPGWPRRKYLVDDALKAALAIPLRRMYLVQLVATIAFVLVALSLLEWRMDAPFVVWFAVYLSVSTALLRRYAKREIEPLLAEAPTTTERAGRMSLQAQAGTCPIRILIAGLAFSALLLAMSAIGVPQDPSFVGAAIVFGLLAGYLALLLVVKLRSRE
jgi:hypothetical protein